MQWYTWEKIDAYTIEVVFTAKLNCNVHCINDSHAVLNKTICIKSAQW